MSRRNNNSPARKYVHKPVRKSVNVKHVNNRSPKDFENKVNNIQSTLASGMMFGLGYELIHQMLKPDNEKISRMCHNNKPLGHNTNKLGCNKENNHYNLCLAVKKDNDCQHQFDLLISCLKDSHEKSSLF
jgi:hypothetical protein